MPRGGKRTGAGRPKGAANKATADIREAAQEYTELALQVLVEVAQTGDSASARVSAANAILDRAYGKPKQALIGGDEDDPAIKTVTRIERRIVRPDDPNR